MKLMQYIYAKYIEMGLSRAINKSLHIALLLLHYTLLKYI